jgi:tRNA (adenine57-N1/adenine58-N1)-methyltransferase
VATSLGRRLLALRPTFAERIVERRRQAQPIYPKDLGAILMQLDVGAGMGVLEAGTGTGALTAALARAVGPGGRVVSYELREDFLAGALESIAGLLGQLPGWIELRAGDVAGLPEGETFDRVALDLAEPWAAVDAAARGLRAGGLLFAHCPNVSQAQRLLDALRERRGFGLMRVVEVLERPWTVRGRSVRPSHRMVAHTGFLAFARRLAGEETFETESEGF